MICGFRIDLFPTAGVASSFTISRSLTVYAQIQEPILLLILSLVFFPHFIYLHNISCLSLFPYRRFVYWIDGAHHIRVSIETLLLSLSLWSSVYYWLLSMRWILFIYSLWMCQRNVLDFPIIEDSKSGEYFMGIVIRYDMPIVSTKFPTPLQKVAG